MQKGIIVHSILFNNKGQALIVKRSEKNDVLPNFWDIPGGTLEDGEDPALGAIREVKEETGLIIQPPDLFFYTSNVDKTKDKQFIRLIFISKIKSSNLTKIVVDPDEHDDFKWINLNEAGNYKLADYLYDCLEIIKSKKHLLFSLC